MSVARACVVLIACSCVVAINSLAGDESDDAASLMKALISKLELLESKVSNIEKRDKNTLNVRKRSTADDTCAALVSYWEQRNATCGNCDCPPGQDGKDGTDGAMGPPGPPGPGMSAEDLELVMKRVLNYTNTVAGVPDSFKDFFVDLNQTGSIYVRWGRTVCSDYSQLLYDGYVAGAHYTHVGGGAEKICLPRDPQYGNKKEGFQSAGYIYGTEYEVSPYNPFSNKNTGGKALHDANAHCAVCLAPARPTQLMIPGHSTCPKGWIQEYHGYLMSERHNHKRSSYDCVDIAPEVKEAGNIANQNGALWYVVETECGGVLPCPPFVKGAELTCTVCTK